MQIDDKTPALVVVWRAFDQSTAAQSSQWLHQQNDTSPLAADMGKLALKRPLPLLEQKLLVKILKGNTPLISKELRIEKRSTEKQFQTSVILPIGPLEYEALSKLNSHVGCSVCGKKAATRCSQCQSVSYCGAG